MARVADLERHLGQSVDRLGILMVDEKTAQGMLIVTPQLGRLGLVSCFRQRGLVDIRAKEGGFIQRRLVGRSAQVIDGREDHNGRIGPGTFQVVQIIGQDGRGFQNPGDGFSLVPGVPALQRFQRHAHGFGNQLATVELHDSQGSGHLFAGRDGFIQVVLLALLLLVTKALDPLPNILEQFIEQRTSPLQRLVTDVGAAHVNSPARWSL